LRLPSPWRVTF
ncbi:uroporphyrinogen decarboxylase family protein, partial [Chlamydia psittaci 84-8471/1]